MKLAHGLTQGRMMLILTRKSGEQITIGDDVRITLLEIRGSQVKLGIEAPPSVQIHRQEVYVRIREENMKAAAVCEGDLSEAAALIGQLGRPGEPQ